MYFFGSRTWQYIPVETILSLVNCKEGNWSGAGEKSNGRGNSLNSAMWQMFWHKMEPIYFSEVASAESVPWQQFHSFMQFSHTQKRTSKSSCCKSMGWERVVWHFGVSVSVPAWSLNKEGVHSCMRQGLPMGMLAPGWARFACLIFCVDCLC